LIQRYLDPDQKRRITPKGLILTKEALKIEDFPIPSCLDPSSTLEEGWVDTLPGTGIEPKKLVALDCEMVSAYCIYINKERDI
jgi:hypothetical protein